MTTSRSRSRQQGIHRAGAFGRRPGVPVDAGALEAGARRRCSAKAWAYVAGGAGSGRTTAASRAAFDAWRIVPRMLRDVSERELATTVLGSAGMGTPMPAPVLLARSGRPAWSTPRRTCWSRRGRPTRVRPYILS